MRNSGYLYITITCLHILFLSQKCTSSIQNTGKLNPGFKSSQIFYIDNDGLFLLSNNSNFAFGFTTTKDVTSFLLVVIHKSSSTIVWSANGNSPVKNIDSFIFDKTGNAYLQSGNSSIWSTNTANKGVSSLQLLDTGNLVLLANGGNVIWQSFNYPTNTLLSNQVFYKGMKLVSQSGSNNLSYSLEIRSNDMFLFAGFSPLQPYWSLTSDSRITVNKKGGEVTSAVISDNSWKFYDPNKVLLWQFIFSEVSNENATWVAALSDDGFVTFSMLEGGSSDETSSKIPEDQCNRPAACDPYYVCYPGIKCQCPLSLPSCRSMNYASCRKFKDNVELVSIGNDLSYFALRFVQPFKQTTLDGCKSSCLKNCSCGAMFFEGSSGKCFLFNEIGSMIGSMNTGSHYDSFVKISTTRAHLGKGGHGVHKRFLIIVIVVIVAFIVLLSSLSVGFRLYRKEKKEVLGSCKDGSEEDNFLEGLSGMPVRFSYKDLQSATDNFTVILGRGGFGSVYKGTLPDGTQLAVKKLEGIGQGKKEFRAEVSIIGSIHHVHLVRLKGFCVEGSHRLLAYEYMSNGSLDRWLFKKKNLDWQTRYNIAVDMAKGLAYLHEDCDVKIVHCDIKPKNVLLDDRFMAKVSDFGLAKLMTREQSHVFTTLRGTRGYLAPEWITNYAISEKSDVYSYGMVLLELIGGRKNFDPGESSGKSHFPSYAFQMFEEGKMKEIVDATMEIDEEDERVNVVICVALWCIQDDMDLRPPMTRVVQMLEGVCPVPVPPTASRLGSRDNSTCLKPVSEGGTPFGPSDWNSDTYISTVRLSGPR